MKIALVNQYTADYQSLADLTIVNRQEYCNKHGYFYHVSREEAPYEPNMGFRRILFILELFKKYNYDYIHCTGIDSLIMNFNIKIEDWIDTNYDFFIAKETSGGYKNINADAFIVKNSSNGIGWLEFIYSKREEYKNTCWHEQRVIIDYYDKLPFSNFIKIMPQQSFNSYPWKFYGPTQDGMSDVHKGEPGGFKLGDFLLHAPGHTLVNRLRIWEHYIPQIIK